MWFSFVCVRVFLFDFVRACVCDNRITHLRNLLTTEAAPEAAMLFLEAMVSFIRVHRCCFGFVLHPFDSELRELRKAILLLPIKKLPLKLHVMTAHLKERYRAMVN